MHALIITKHAHAKLEALREVAEANVVPFQEMYRRNQEFQARGGRQPGEMGRSDMTVMLRVGYSCTYTVEEHRPGVSCRHISVSGPNQLPHPKAVTMLMKIMGFQRELLDAMVWTEDVGGGQMAINVLEPVSGDWGPLTTKVEGTMQ